MWAAGMMEMGKISVIGAAHSVSYTYRSTWLPPSEGSLPFISHTSKFRRMKGIDHSLILSNPSFDKG
jgi:hypothetical protein